MIKNVIVIEFFKEAKRNTEFYQSKSKPRDTHSRCKNNKKQPKMSNLSIALTILEPQGKQKKVDEMVTM